MIVFRKKLVSGLYIRKFDRYINTDNSGDHEGTNDDPSRLEGYLDESWVDEGVLAQVNRSGTISDLDTHVICGLFRPDVSGTWHFRIRCDDAGYLWVGSNAEPLEWNLNKNNALCDAGGAHGEINSDGSVTLTAGVFYAIKAMVGDRGGGDAFRIDFSGPTGSLQSAELSNTGRDGTGFYFHNPYANNGYNLNS